jgi:bifunctional DNA-binding transcriptional regulator/antitoxin component of YhaV-PrlF toxin-antitoxin module
MNSFGNITIPAGIRKEMEISGNVTLWVGTRELLNGEKEIIIRRSNNAEETLKKYQKWAEVISRITECAVALVLNGKVLSMSAAKLTESFLDKDISVNPDLAYSCKKIKQGGVLIGDKKPLNFLSNGQGEVSAIFKINNTGEDACYFVIIKGTKYAGKKISSSEEDRRYSIVNDILEKI